MQQNDSDATTDRDEFPEVLESIHRRFAEHAEGPLLVTEAMGLWEIFLETIPPELQAVYACTTCRRFITRYGAMVTVDDGGQLSAALWPTDAPRGFDRAFARLGEAVVAAPIRGVLIPPTKVLGTPASKPTQEGAVWSHFYVEVPKAHSHPLLTAGQVAAERRQDWQMLSRGLAEFPLGLVDRALTLLKSDTLYRSEKCIGVATWLAALHRSLAAVADDRRRDALLWRAVATAPAGYPHVRSGMIGTLLEDLASGLDTAAIKRRFDAKMDPSQYMRAQVAPAAGNIAQAEKMIAGLKASGSLSRRFASLSDVAEHLLWQPAVAPAKAPPAGVFGHLTPKAAKPVEPLAIPAQTMTWEKFARKVLPDARSIEVQIPSANERFVALVTAAEPESPPILQWDSEERRNQVSWYYHAGIDAEMRRRVEGAGGQYEGVDIRASLLWNNRNDLDLHVMTPGGEHIYYGHKQSKCGGWLDVDMNVGGETTVPVENTRWGRGIAKRGRYSIFVRNYRFHERGKEPTPFRVEVEINGEIYHFADVASPHAETGPASDVQILSFDYVPGQPLANPPRTTSAAPGTNHWNVATGTWVSLTGVLPSPNLWGERPLVQHGRHTFFLLEGCRDASEGRGRGFFVETLRSELHSVRSTIEAFTRSAEIAGADEANACGLGMTDQRPWDLLLRVKTDDAVAIYKIDRQD